MAHPAWKEVPVDAIYHHIAFEGAEQSGAKKREAADLDANLNRSGGHSRKPRQTQQSGGVAPVKDMDEETFQKLQDDVMTGQFKPEE